MWPVLLFLAMTSCGPTLGVWRNQDSTPSPLEGAANAPSNASSRDMVGAKVVGGEPLLLETTGVSSKDAGNAHEALDDNGENAASQVGEKTGRVAKVNIASSHDWTHPLDPW